MQTLDPAGEWLRLAEHYRQLDDDALIGLARQTSGLTDTAQQVLAQEIATRQLKIAPEEPTSALRPSWKPDSDSDTESPYAEDRELVNFWTVWSRRDAFKLQRLLDVAGIPFFMGPENATDVEAVTSNFASGLTVRIMQVGWPWASRAMRDYYPEDVPPTEQVDESVTFAVHCPKCRSEEVVFETPDQGPETPDPKTPSSFHWTCDSCGHQWENDGTMTPS